MNNARPRAPGEKPFGYLLLLFGCLTFYFATRISGFSSISSPGVFPMIAAAIMVGSALAVVLRNRRLSPPAGDGADSKTFLEAILPARIAVMIAMIVAYTLLLEPAGFVVASAIFLFAAICYLERCSILMAGLVTAGCIALVYVVFRIVFTVVLPRGWIWP